jgi:hypothetical protein
MTIRINFLLVFVASEIDGVTCSFRVLQDQFYVIMQTHIKEPKTKGNASKCQFPVKKYKYFLNIFLFYVSAYFKRTPQFIVATAEAYWNRYKKVLP